MEFTAENFRNVLKEGRRLFGININPFIETEWFVMGEIAIDIVAFDDKFLHKRFPGYDANDDKSAEDVVRENFGEEAVTFLEALL